MRLQAVDALSTPSATHEDAEPVDGLGHYWVERLKWSDVRRSSAEGFGALRLCPSEHVLGIPGDRDQRLGNGALLGPQEMFLVRPQSDDDTAPAIPVAPGVDRDTTGDERIDVLVVGVAQVLLARGVKGSGAASALACWIAHFTPSMLAV